MYQRVWLAFVHIDAIDGYVFNDLVDLEDAVETEPYTGAWANILVIADDIHEALAIVPKGLLELKFKVVFIDKIENLESPIEYQEVKPELIEEAEWLLASEFVFKISDRIFPYR